jgi:hypothetical protein
MEEHKDSIIIQKLDTLFGYLSEYQSSEKFKKQIKEYSIDNRTLHELQTEHDELHANPHKLEMARAKLRQIHELKNTMKKMLSEYKTEGDEGILEVISNIYVNEYMPEIRNLQMLQYEIMEVNANIYVDSSVEEQYQKAPTEEYWLFQRDVALAKDDILSGEPPRVIAYNSNAGEPTGPIAFQGINA